MGQNQRKSLVIGESEGFSEQQKSAFHTSLKAFKGLSYKEAMKVIWELRENIEQLSKISF
jgi:hypothetical protein